MYTRIDGAHSRVPLGRYKIGAIARDRRPQLTNQVVGDPQIHDQEWVRREGLVAFAGYPLVVHDRVLGVMAMFARHALSEFVPKALGSVASAVTVGIERKRAEEALRRSEEQLRQAQKMEAVGRLAGGIAHDFNNLLTVITAYGDLLLEDLAPEDSRRDALGGGGRQTSEAANMEQVEGRPGRYVLLAVSDTGSGMDDETKARIFEPFFTTKESGKGTGPGLATVYGIVKQAGGFIWVDSEPGRGTSFEVYLPRVDEPVAPAITRSAPAEPGRGTETVLVVEDAPAVRLVMRQVLERYGYTVLEAPTGDMALRLAAKHHGPIHLLLTDVVMPGLSGRQLAGQLSQLRSEMKVLYVSGYADTVENGVAVALQ